MKRGRGGNLLLFGIAGLCGVLAAAFAYAYMEKRLAAQREALQQNQVPVVERPELRQVVVARDDVSRGERLTKADLQVMRVPAEGVLVGGVVTEPEDAVGRVAIGNLYAGEWLVDRKLATPGDPRKGLDSLLESGHRAIRLPVDQVSGLLGILEPDDRVDVVGVFTSADGDRTVGRTLLQNVPVLAVGQHGVPGSGQADPAKARREQAGRREATVTLDVTRQQAETIALALGVGKVHLTLRNKTTPPEPPSDGVDTHLLERVAETQEPRTTPPRHVVEILHGDRIEQQVVTR